MYVHQYLNRCILYLNCCYYISHFSLPVSRRVSITPIFRFYLKTIRLKHFDERLNALKLQLYACCNVNNLCVLCICVLYE
jgi:hypothetical protein